MKKDNVYWSGRYWRLCGGLAAMRLMKRNSFWRWFIRCYWLQEFIYIRCIKKAWYMGKKQRYRSRRSYDGV